MRIAFGGHEVEIRADDTSVLGSLAGSYRHMKGAAQAPPASVSEIRRVPDGSYQVIPAHGDPATRATLHDAVRWARTQVTEGFLRARRDLMWLHGAAVAREGRAIILPGRRGEGKSTLATALCELGWSFLTDDLIPLDPSALRAHPFPRVPEVREDPGEEQPRDWVARAPKSSYDVSRRLATGPLPVAAVVFPRARRGSDAPTLATVGAGEAVLAIAEGCWNFADLGELAPASLSRLVSDVPTRALTFSDAEAAARLVAGWFDAGAR